MSMQQSESLPKSQGINSEQGGCVRPSLPAWRVNGYAADRAKRVARRDRERAEIAEAIRLGVEVIPKVRFDRFWQQWEDDLLLGHEDDLAASRRALPHRSSRAIEHRRSELGLTPKLRAWTTGEERVLRQNYLKVASIAALAKLLPTRSADVIGKHMRLLGLRIPPRASDTGSSVLDAVKDRCRVLGYSRADLDGLAGTGRYFQNGSWRRGHARSASDKQVTQLSGALTKAVNALGGTLRVVWPDDGESIDTIDIGEG